jgi:hypothetical protein
MMSDELLYRGIKRSQPSTVRPDGRRVTSALFKDANGVSVDRMGGRTEQAVIVQMKEFFQSRLKGVARLKEQAVMQAEACALPAPTDKNPYHAEIYANIKKQPLTNLQCLKLADACTLIFLDEKVQWIH